MIKEQEAVRVVSLMLTWACNLNCTYCFELFKRSGREMSIEVANREFLATDDRIMSIGCFGYGLGCSDTVGG